jgi:hypothetical protein
MDHRFEGNAVFPAVEAMQLLAASALSLFPKIQPRMIHDAVFEKFLYLNKDLKETEIFIEFIEEEDGTLKSSLTSRTRSKTYSISRMKEHVSMLFHETRETQTPLPDVQKLADLESQPFRVPASRVYSELVPFGPSYHNISGDLFLSEHGALATIRTPEYKAASGPLGSPFPLDAAFHAACAWCQRYLQFIGFPVGFQKRQVIHPTLAGEEYTARIIPVQTKPDALICDGWIWDRNGRFFEAVSNLVMRDVAVGRKRPPQWITGIH